MLYRFMTGLNLITFYATLFIVNISSFRNHNVDVSVAVSTDSGLITPIVFNADKKVKTSLKYNIWHLHSLSTDRFF